MKPPPSKAFILAAGFGTRLLPLTRVVPKPLLPLGGIPMLDRALSMVQSWGVKQVVVNVHHGAHALVHHLIHTRHPGLEVNISFEPDILGTGGALSKASWFFRAGEPFWMVNADVASDLDPAAVRRAFRPGKTIASAWLMGTRGPRTVECVRGRITNFQSKTPGAPGTFTFCGVHLVDPAVLRYLPREGMASIINAYQEAMKDGWTVAGVPVENAWWADIGTPAQYVEAEAECRARERKRRNIISDSDKGVSVIDGFIYGPGVPRKPFSGIMAMRAMDALDDVERRLAGEWTGRLDRATACPLSPRGSARTFTRLYDGSRTALLIRHKPDREENNLYTGHSRFLRGLGMPVPFVIAEDAVHHAALYEDVGLASVQEEAPRWTQARLASVYRDMLDALVVFHEQGAREAARKSLHLMPGFDAKLYDWEHNLFTGLFLRDRMRVSEERIAEVDRELKQVSAALLAAPSVLVHRDLQSSNLILRGRRWSFIDYQGMRLGPAVYDLASLLCDPYIEIRPETREALLQHYAASADPRSRCIALFWHGAVQRLGQALGAYARLSKLSGMSHFARYIRPALIHLDEATRRVSGLNALGRLVRDALEKA